MKDQREIHTNPKKVTRSTLPLSTGTSKGLGCSGPAGLRFAPAMAPPDPRQMERPSKAGPAITPTAPSQSRVDTMEITQP